MRSALITGIAFLLAVALIPPAAQAATQVRQVQVPMSDVSGIPPNQASPGTLTLDFVFKNTRSNKKRFTPRQLIKIDLSKVPLDCANGHTSSPGHSKLLYTATFETKIKLKKVPKPHPKPGSLCLPLRSLQLSHLRRHDRGHDRQIQRRAQTKAAEVPGSSQHFGPRRRPRPLGLHQLSSHGRVMGWRSSGCRLNGPPHYGALR